jgi:HlyD family secretion protein
MHAVVALTRPDLNSSNYCFTLMVNSLDIYSAIESTSARLKSRPHGNGLSTPDTAVTLMNRRKKSRSHTILRRLAVFLSALTTLAGVGFGWMHWHERKPPGERYDTVNVRRADLFPIRTASGRLESGKRTIIECKLENIAVGIRGQNLAAGGASVLLNVIPEGTFVKQGDVLATLDSSDYEELLRLQRITLERARADHQQAELDVEIARLAVREFEEGLMAETLQDFEGKILLGRADLERAVDRLNWSRRMNGKGYIPAAVVTSDEFKKQQAALLLSQQEVAYALFKKYTGPKNLQVLKGAVTGAGSILEYQDLRLRRNEYRLASLEKQVENCTIRAPHDGFVIYANNADREQFIEAGIPVRQRQPLFYLPDLDDMEVVAMLHESIVDHINLGMRAVVQVEGLANRRIEGHVTSVAPMATLNYRSDVRYFESIVKLDNAPAGLRPGMTAEVTIALPRLDDVLAVPSEAIRAENGHDFCFVVHEDGLERREVKLGQVTAELSQITQGLAEGEQVVINAANDDLEREDSTVHTDLLPGDSAPKPESAASVIAALH